MAIKNFQIRSVYTFWMDISSEDSKKLFLHKTYNELLCSFMLGMYLIFFYSLLNQLFNIFFLLSLIMLDLPDVCCDINSQQFYNILNVCRYLLLAPPPPKVSNSLSNSIFISLIMYPFLYLIS